MSYDYYVDENGKITKKKKKKQGTNYYVDEKGKITKTNKNDIAPVKGGNKNSVFKSGAFSDGIDGVGDFIGNLGKSIVGTVGDVGVGIGKGLTRLGEGLGDAARYGIAGVADLTGNDDYANRLRKSAKENDTDKAWKKAEKKVDNWSVLGNKADAVTEGLGQVAGMILTGGAAGALGASSGVATALTMGTTGVSSMGSGMSEAYNSGATNKQALIYGGISGTAEVATELLFGGLGKTVKAVGLSKGLSSADDMLAKKVSGLFSNQIAKNFAEYGIKAGAEGTEEVLSGIAQAVGKKVTYMKDEDLKKILNDEDLLQQFVVGSITSGIAQSGVVPGMKQGSLIEANKQGKDFITGLTVNEQKVVDKEFENRIAESEKDGKKLDKKEKSELYDKVLYDLDKGYISIDTIESALGDKTYETYKTMEEQENSLKKEIESLENTPESQFTVKQRERLTELREELAKIDKTQIKEQLSNEVSELAKVDRLSESYNERSRKSQAFQADLNKYDVKQQETIKKAIDSGILNNSNRTHEFVDIVAKVSADKGVLFDFTNNQKLKELGVVLEGKTINGYVKDNNITLNIDSGNLLNSVVGHEITHVLEGTELYPELQKAVKEYASTKGIYETRFKELKEIYKDVEGANIENELTSDLIGDYLFTDKDFINNLSVEKPNIFKKIFNEIKYLCKMVTAGSKEARQLEKVKKTFEDAYKQTTSKNTDKNYSLSDSDGKALTKEQQEYFKNIIPELKDDNGNLKVLYHGTPNEFTQFNYDFIGSNGTALGKGFYLTDSRDIASGYVGESGKIMELYANIEKPLSLTEKNITKANYKKFVKAVDKATGGDYLSNYGEVDYEGYNNVLSRALDDYTYDDNDVDLIHSVFNTSGIGWEEGFRLLKKTLGYDGVVQQDFNGTGTTVFVPTLPEQIKSVTNQNPTDNIDINMSLSKQGNDIAPNGNYKVYGKDIALDQNKALVQEPVSKMETTTEDYAPVKEIANKQETKQNTNTSEDFEKVVQRYMNSDEVPGFLFEEDEIRKWAEEEARKNPLGPKDTTNTKQAESPFEERDIYEIGKDRKTNAYMYENPEVKPFFQEEAQVMLWELQNSTKGERVKKGVKYGLDGEIGAFDNEWLGTKRHTSDELAYLKDNFKYSRDELEKGLRAIIEDHGAENNAVSKRIEFMIDERLRDGYKDFIENKRVAPNQDYINLLNEKQITEYNDESFNNWVQTLKENDNTTQPMQEDIAPIKQGSEMQLPTDKMTRPNEPNIVDVPNRADGKKERSWVETSTESEPVARKILPDDLDQNAITYEPISNKKTLDNANAMLDRRGYDGAVTHFIEQFDSKKLSLDDIALGERLIQEAIKKGDMKTAGELIQNVSILGTELGQKVQALSIIQRLTPEGQLKMLNKVVERGKIKGDKVFEGVEITQEMTDRILSTYDENGTYNQDKLNEAVEDVKQQIADQMKVTKAEKINAWRYLSMLGNAKTHGRNIIANVGMKGTMAVKDAIARTIETVAPVKTRTKTWKPASEDVKEFAKQTTKEMKAILADGSKYSETSNIKAKREIFKNKILNGIYEFNSDMLSKEDWWFQGSAFNKSFSEYLTANGIKTKEDIQNNPELIEKAKAYATEQSEIATFKQFSFLANWLRKLENHNTATGVAVGAIVPFKNTPINIAKAGFNYSPLGFMKTLTQDVSKVKKGDMEASQLIDNLSQNLTGTGLTLAGYMLAMSGFLNGAGGEDKESKYDYQLGKQAYSVNIGGKNYSLSWLTPMAMPLFVGANAYEILTEGMQWDANVVIEALEKTFNPMTEMSLLSGLTDVMSSYGNDSSAEKFAGMGITAGQNYITQFIPTLSSQLATYMDDKQRSTKVAANSGFNLLDETVNKLKLKIPGLRETLEPATDIWGNEVKLNDNKMQKAFDTFIAPYAQKENKASEIDKQLKDLYGDTGDGGLFPQIPRNSVNYEGEKYNMSAKEYTSFKKTYGQNALDLMEELFKTTTYQNANPTDKADMVDKVYDYASDEAKREYLAKQDVEFTNATKDGQKYYKENNIKGAIENDMNLEEFDFYNKYPKKYKFLQKNNVSYDEYNKDKETRKAYNWAYSNPDKYTLSKAVAKDIVTYKSYSKDLYNIKSDKDKYGRSITGSRKQKVVNYINNLDADYGEKLILFKSEYNSDDTYNREIIDYLNNREDINFDEMNTILKQLGFTVKSDGTIYW